MATGFVTYCLQHNFGCLGIQYSSWWLRLHCFCWDWGFPGHYLLMPRSMAMGTLLPEEGLTPTAMRCWGHRCKERDDPPHHQCNHTTCALCLSAASHCYALNVPTQMHTAPAVPSCTAEIQYTVAYTQAVCVLLDPFETLKVVRTKHHV